MYKIARIFNLSTSN